jgi:hypothetical protein
MLLIFFLIFYIKLLKYVLHIYIIILIEKELLMPEDVSAVPLDGPGSRTPSALPAMHTPVGEGAKSTGVNNVGKPKGLPGAPALGDGAAGAPAGGLPGAAPAPEVKTPEDLLIDRSNDRLSKDLQDVYLQFFQDNDDVAPGKKSSSLKTSNITYDIKNVDFDYVIDRLINQKGWHVDRLKELLPSRDEKAIKEYFNKVLNSNTSEKVDVDQQENNTLDMFNNNQGSNNLMGKNADLIVDNGSLKTASANSGALLDEISYSIGQVRIARKNLKKAYLVKVGFEAMKDEFSGMADMPMDPEMGGDIDGGMPGADIDVDAFGEGLGGGDKDLKGLISAVEDALSNLTAKVEEFGLTSDSLGSDDMLKGDSLMDKASEEIDGADSDLAAIDTFDNKSKEKKDKPEKKEGNPFAKKEEGAETESKSEDKFASIPTGGKAVSMPEGAGWEQKGGKSEGSSEEAMKVTTGEKSAYLKEIKEKLAQLKQVRETSMNKEAAYPYNDLNKQEGSGIMEDTAKSQASEINSDMSGGFIPDTESLAPQGITEKVKDPGMEVSKDANIQKSAAVDDFNKVTAAANSLARKAVAQAVAKTRVAMEVSAIQQLKGLLVNPLKEELVARFAEYGVEKVAAQALVHNAFVSAYEDSQKIVIAEAFDVLANKDDNEFVKVASFTKDFKGASADGDADDVKADEGILDDKEKEASAEAKTVKTASLRGSQVNNDNSQVYTGFWRSAYEESKGN